MYCVDLLIDGQWVLLAWGLSVQEARRLVLSAVCLHGAEARLRRDESEGA